MVPKNALSSSSRSQGRPRRFESSKFRRTLRAGLATDGLMYGFIEAVLASRKSLNGFDGKTALLELVGNASSGIKSDEAGDGVPIGVRPEFLRGVRPEFLIGVSPEFEMGVNPEFPIGVRPEFEIGVNPVFGIGVRSEESSGTSPLLSRGLSFAVGIGTSPVGADV